MNTRLLVLRHLIGASFVVVCGVSSQADVAEPGGKLTITGTVVMQDATPAAGAWIESTGNAGESPIQSQADKQGRFQLSGHFGYGCRLHVHSADDCQHAVLMVSAGEARTRLAKPLIFKLTPAVEKIITVSSAAGEPVAGARVVANGRTYRRVGVTGADGTAKLKLPAGDELQGIVAWHPTLGAAGRRDLKHGLQGAVLHVALLPQSPHTIRILTVEGQPVADIAFGASIRTADDEWIITRDVESAQLRTNRDGEASATWFPKDLLGVDVDLESHEWKIDDIERDKLADGLTTVRVRRKVAVAGRLKMPQGASAEGIVVSGFGFGPQHRGDISTARAAADGSFTLNVASDHGYALHISDIEWASDGWTGLILADENSKPAEIRMDVYRATPLEVRVKRGEGHEPIVDAWVYSRCDRHFSFRNSKGAVRNATAGGGQWMRTDEAGVAHLGVGKGDQKLRLNSGDWTEERTVSITSDSPQVVEFYRPWRTNRKITGRLLTGDAPHKPSPTATIEAAAIAPSYQRFALKSSLNPDGTFEVEGDAGDLSILVIDREQSQGGFVRIGASDSTVDLQLLTLGSYAGTVVDHEGQPRARELLRLAVKDTDHLAAADMACDELGRFKFPLALAGAPLVVQVRQQTPNGSYFRQVDELLLMASETRENPRLVADLRDPAERRSRSNSSVPLSDQIALATRNARLSGMHALAILQGASSDAMTRLVEAVSTYEDQPDILAYVLLFVDEKTLKSNGETLKELGWPLPQQGEAVLVALDGDAKPLGTQRLEVAEVNAAGKLATAHLKKHLPPVRDAQARLTAAREEASGSGRKVWIVEGGPRCGPCFRLARWMDDQHAILEKDYVILKVMGGLDQHAEEVIKPLNRPQSGIPWYAITEVDGKVLATSEGPLGNIGMPSSVEGIRHLRTMLEQTATHLTVEDLDGLAESLANFK